MTKPLLIVTKLVFVAICSHGQITCVDSILLNISADSAYKSFCAHGDKPQYSSCAIKLSQQYEFIDSRLYRQEASELLKVSPAFLAGMDSVALAKVGAQLPIDSVSYWGKPGMYCFITYPNGYIMLADVFYTEAYRGYKCSVVANNEVIRFVLIRKREAECYEVMLTEVKNKGNQCRFLED